MRRTTARSVLPVAPQSLSPSPPHCFICSDKTLACSQDPIHETARKISTPQRHTSRVNRRPCMHHIGTDCACLQPGRADSRLLQCRARTSLQLAHQPDPSRPALKATASNFRKSLEIPARSVLTDIVAGRYDAGVLRPAATKPTRSSRLNAIRYGPKACQHLEYSAKQTAK